MKFWTVYLRNSKDTYTFRAERFEVLDGALWFYGDGSEIDAERGAVAASEWLAVEPTEDVS